MSKHFRPWKIDEVQLLPPSVADYVAKEHLSRLIVGLVRESLDLSGIASSYASGLGQPPFDPRMMTALLLHGYGSGIYSSRRLAKAAVERADFMMIVAATRRPSVRSRSSADGISPPWLVCSCKAEACREGGLSEAWARLAGRHQDQGERVETQGNELRSHEEAASGA